jgi:hypothetical protein
MDLERRAAASEGRAGREVEQGGRTVNEYMKALQAILLGAKVLGITDAPWLWIFIPTLYAFCSGAAEGIAVAIREAMERRP